MKYDNLIWFKHASFLWDGSKKIYFDPWEIDDSRGKADLILISHSHYDHCDPTTVERLKKDETVVIGPADCLQKISGTKRTLLPGENLTHGEVVIETVRAYNIDKPFHPKENNWVGYIVSVDGVRIYHAGDTDVIPEMRDVKTGVALLPVGGTYTMNVEKAVRAAKTIKLEVAIPMHYGTIVGSQKDGRNFAEILGKKAKILIPIIPFQQE